jgi:hypothetical protein
MQIPLSLELNLSWYALCLFLHGTPFGFIGIGWIQDFASERLVHP